MNAADQNFHPLALSLDEIAPATSAGVGGKARHLSELKHAGFAVPEAFALPAQTFETAISAAGGDLLAWRKAFAANAADDGKQLRDAILKMPLSQPLKAVLQRVHTSLISSGYSALAVRSSAILEDLEDSSFAGLYETVLDVRGVDALGDALRICWASAFTPRVRDYCLNRGIPVTELQPACLIQGMIPAECAGVVFTVDPVRGHDTEMLIEAVPGLGNTLVDGEQDPVSWRYDWMRDRVSHEGVGEAALFGRPLLTTAQLRDLGKLALAIQSHYGRPQDIEWAWFEGRFHILQSRSIAAIHHDVSEQWTNADFKDGGVAAHIPCALMWSLYEGVLEHSMPSYLASIGLMPRPAPQSWTLMRCGFPYWNLSAVKDGLQRIPGFTERTFDADLGIETNYEGDGRCTGLTPRTLVAGLRTLYGIHKSVRRRLRDAPKTLKALDRLLSDLEEVECDRLDAAALAEHIEALFTRHHRVCETAYFTTIYDNSNLATLFRQSLDKHNAGLRRRGHAELDYLALAGGLSDVPHLNPVRDLWRVSRELRGQPDVLVALQKLSPGELNRRHLAGDNYPGDMALKVHIRAHGHRASRELDLTVPRWHEDPLPVFETLMTLLECDDSENPDRNEERAQAQNDAAVKRIGSSGLRRALKRHRSMLVLREQMRERSTRMYRVVRSAAMALGRRLVEAGHMDAPEMVMHLTSSEVISLARASAPSGDETRITELLAVLRKRRDYYLGFRNYPRPNEIMPRVAAPPASRIQADADGLRGIVCSPGVAEGVVRVLDGIHQADQVERGDILLTAYTDPAWTPLFARISGLITETGGVLSHGAVVSREYGIPAVLGVKDARRRLRTGMRVRLDGETGVITPIPSIAPNPAETSTLESGP